ncbi:MAG: hypothetical protein KatS3mg109_0616 [Pirellulaceae bacterium]|nr:MAG: hypothetical protein KatS3mg109_0616 [Pirellulaceae bacterium]
MKIFLAGIMQGSLSTHAVHDQSYRRLVVEQLRKYLPQAEIYDPWSDHQNSLDYDDDHARQVFLYHNRLCGQVDLLLAYVPQASMGTAIEMWEAFRHGKLVVTVSPLEHNWSVKFLSDRIYPNWDAFFAELAGGAFLRWFQAARAAKASRVGS